LRIDPANRLCSSMFSLMGKSYLRTKWKHTNDE
jgi:hypothetical protein